MEQAPEHQRSFLHRPGGLGGLGLKLIILGERISRDKKDSTIGFPWVGRENLLPYLDTPSVLA